MALPRTVDVLAQAIRVTDGDHTRGAGVMAEDLLEELDRQGYMLIEKPVEADHLTGWAKGHLQFHLIWDHELMPTKALYDMNLDGIHRDAHENSA